MVGNFGRLIHVSRPARDVEITMKDIFHKQIADLMKEVDRRAVFEGNECQGLHASRDAAVALQLLYGRLQNIFGLFPQFAEFDFEEHK